ncbi:MAG: hypothetical protein AAF223_16195, partial [Bacteroidota bacterium]
MKSIFALFILIITTVSSSHACDVCGCSLGSNYFGILPQFDKHFVGVRWHHSSFFAQMNHNSELLEREYSNDSY